MILKWVIHTFEMCLVLHAVLWLFLAVGEEYNPRPIRFAIHTRSVLSLFHYVPWCDDKVTFRCESSLYFYSQNLWHGFRFRRYQALFSFLSVMLCGILEWTVVVSSEPLKLHSLNSFFLRQKAWICSSCLWFVFAVSWHDISFVFASLGFEYLVPWLNDDRCRLSMWVAWR